MIALPLGADSAATLALVVTPGASTAVVVRNSLEGGWRGGVSTALGIVVANSTYALAAGLGLAVLLHESPTASAALSIGGALYLAWLAYGSLRRAVVGGPSLVDRIGAPTDGVSRSGFRQGLTVNLLNPAIATFYLAIVPTFLPPGAGGDAFAVLATIHVSMAFGCHLIWTAAFDRLRHIVTRPGPMRVVELVAGTTLLMLSARTMFRW